MASVAHTLVERRLARLLALRAVGIPIFTAVVTGLLFTWGGIRDIRRLFQALSTGKENHSDNGTVTNHGGSLDALEPSPGKPGRKPAKPALLGR